MFCLFYLYTVILFMRAILEYANMRILAVSELMIKS